MLLSLVRGAKIQLISSFTKVNVGSFPTEHTTTFVDRKSALPAPSFLASEIYNNVWCNTCMYFSSHRKGNDPTLYGHNAAILRNADKVLSSFPSYGSRVESFVQPSFFPGQYGWYCPHYLKSPCQYSTGFRPLLHRDGFIFSHSNCFQPDVQFT